LTVLGAAALATSPGCRGPAEPRPRAPPGGGPTTGGGGIPTAESLGETTAPLGAHLALVYGSNLLGAYETCGCPSQPLGGLGRRATVVDRARAEGAAVLVLDAGDALMPAPVPAPVAMRPAARTRPRAWELERRAALILGAYARMGMGTAGALLPAERDLGIGLPTLERLLARYAIPAVASNLSRPDGGPVFLRDRLVTPGGVAVGIFGVVEPVPEDAALWRSWPLRVDDPVATARTEVASLRQRGARVVVALVHLGSNAAVRRLLESAPGIDFVVTGHTQMQTETVDVVGGARRVEAFALGNLAGRLDIHVVEPAARAGAAAPTGGPLVFVDRGDRAELVTIIADHRRQLVELDRRAAEDHTTQLQAYYRSRHEGLTAALVHEQDLLAKVPRAITGSWFENRLIPLDASIPEQPGVKQLVTAYDAENARSLKRGDRPAPSASPF
jgi:hypothetical protein